MDSAWRPTTGHAPKLQFFCLCGCCCSCACLYYEEKKKKKRVQLHVLNCFLIEDKFALSEYAASCDASSQSSFHGPLFFCLFFFLQNILIE